MTEPPTERRSLARLLASPVVVAVAVIGLGLRIWVLVSPQGGLNGDEAYTGLQAADIARGHLVVVIGGAAYTGTIDTYLLAPVLWLTGLHVAVLKAMSPAFWAAAAVLMVAAGRKLIGDRAALLAGSMIWLAPGALLVVSTRAYVAYAFGLAIVTATLLAGSVLIDRESPDVLPAAVFGALAGLAFYTHPMFATVAGPVAAVVLARHWRSVREVWLPAVGAAVAVNLPFLGWNIRNDWASLDQPPVEGAGTYGGRLRRFITGLLPRDLGLRRIGTGEAAEWVFGKVLGVLVLVAVLALACFGVWRLARVDPWRAALLGVPFVLVWPLMAALPNLSYIDDGRYGIIAFPVLILCVAAGVEPLTARWREVWPVLAAAWLVVCSLPFLYKEAGTDLGDPNEETQAIIDVLEAEGFNRLAGNYFKVLPVEYMSDSSIRVAVAGNPYVVRLAETQRLVDATQPDRLAYVFNPGPIDPSWVKLPIDQYRQVPVGSVVLYLPT